MKSLLIFVGTLLFSSIHREINRANAIHFSSPGQRDTIPFDTSYPEDYGSPTWDLGQEVYKLRPNNYPVTGNWISSKGAGLTMLLAILFRANEKALEKNYGKSLTYLLNYACDNLEKNTGQLSSVTYNYGKAGPDPSSIRVSHMGIGKSPEESLAQGPIAQIDKAYEVNSAAEQYSFHYVFIYKTSNGKLRVTTIQGSFIGALKSRAALIKIEDLNKPISQENFVDSSDHQISEFERAERLINISEKDRQSLIDQKRINEFETLRKEFLEKQTEYDALKVIAKRAASENGLVSKMIGFLERTMEITRLFNGKPAIEDQNKMDYYYFMQAEIKSVEKQALEARNKVNDYIRDLEKLHKTSKIIPD